MIVRQSVKPKVTGRERRGGGRGEGGSTHTLYVLQ